MFQLVHCLFRLSQVSINARTGSSECRQEPVELGSLRLSGGLKRRYGSLPVLVQCQPHLVSCGEKLYELQRHHAQARTGSSTFLVGRACRREVAQRVVAACHLRPVRNGNGDSALPLAFGGLIFPER